MHPAVRRLCALALLLSPAAAIAAPPSIPEGLRCLRAAYPDHVCEVRPDALVWCDGTVMPWDDGRAKATLEDRLATADLEDQMAARYPAGPTWPDPLPVDFDPGRVRHEPFFLKLYGASRAAVKATLAPVRWLRGTPGSNRTVYVTRTAGAADALQAVSDELDRLPGALKALLAKPSGTFVWRKIRGVERLSMHSFAIAIDVAVARSDYWRWRKPDADGRYPYRNRIPVEIVEIFERHGFIWGGKWYHFDTMHFEYRPELLAPPCVDRAGDGVARRFAASPRP